MTLVDIKNILFSHFLTETTFSLKDDLAPIKLEGKKIDEVVVANKEALFRAGLDDFVRTGVLVKATDDLYILTQPIDSFSQTITLAPIVAEMVGDLINDVGQELGMTNHLANKLSITSDDIGAICQICHVLLDENFSTEGGPEDGYEDRGYADS